MLKILYPGGDDASGRAVSRRVMLWYALVVGVLMSHLYSCQVASPPADADGIPNEVAPAMATSSIGGASPPADAELIPNLPWPAFSEQVLQRIRERVGEGRPFSLSVDMQTTTLDDGFDLSIMEGRTAQGSTFTGFLDEIAPTPPSRDFSAEYAILERAYAQIRVGPQELYPIARQQYPEWFAGGLELPLRFRLYIDYRPNIPTLPVWFVTNYTDTSMYTLQVNAVDGSILRRQEVNFPPLPTDTPSNP